MEIRQFDIWLADLNPRMGTESGKTRPVLIVQSDLLNRNPHLSTLICPITTNVQKESDILRVHLKKGLGKLKKDCDVMIDQVRSIDNIRLTEHIGTLPDELIEKVKENLLIVLDLED
jgi:mRNA interferase MazF